MSGNKSIGNGPANGPDHEEGSGSDFTIVDAPSSESNGSAGTENEIIDGMSDVHVSEAAGLRRKDEYDVDFECVPQVLCRDFRLLTYCSGTREHLLFFGGEIF
jgi:hypothetical protein